MLIIEPLPETHCDGLPQTISFRIGEPQEDLIGRAAKKQFTALLRQCFTDAVGLKHGVTAELKAKLFGKERIELDAEHLALGEHSAVLLHQREEPRHVWPPGFSPGYRLREAPFHEG